MFKKFKMNKKVVYSLGIFGFAVLNLFMPKANFTVGVIIMAVLVLGELVEERQIKNTEE